jgi:rhodanese-related sulfurtransferase
MGYRNVAVYNEGIPEWVKRGYPANVKKVYPAIEIPIVSAAALKGMLDGRQDVVVVDIRDDDDARSGRVPGSVHLEIELLDERLAELPHGKKLVLVDMHGKQTQLVGRFLASKGFRDVARLDGGFVGGWIKAGYPFAR